MNIICFLCIAAINLAARSKKRANKKYLVLCTDSLTLAFILVL